MKYLFFFSYLTIYYLELQSLSYSTRILMLLSGWFITAVSFHGGVSSKAQLPSPACLLVPFLAFSTKPFLIILFSGECLPMRVKENWGGWRRRARIEGEEVSVL